MGIQILFQTFLLQKEGSKSFFKDRSVMMELESTFSGKGSLRTL